MRKEKEKGISKLSSKKVNIYKILDLRQYYYYIIDTFIIRPKILIQMINSNNELVYFYAYTDVQYFEKNKGLYVIDTSLATYSPTFTCKILTYHEKCSVPVNFQFKIANIYDEINKTNLSQVSASFDPRSLLKFQNSKMIESFVRGSTKSANLPLIVILMAINIILTGFIIYFLINGGL